jgi:predicted RNase H-like nuclease (RuvC/YqgF family)
VEENSKSSVDAASVRAPDVVDSEDIAALRSEILRLRDAVAGAATHEAILDDRVEELESQVEELADELEKLSRLTSHPAVRALMAVTRPVRRYLERRRAGS